MKRLILYFLVFFATGLGCFAKDTDVVRRQIEQKYDKYEFRFPRIGDSIKYVVVHKNGKRGVVYWYTGEEIVPVIYKYVDRYTYDEHFAQCDDKFFHLSSRQMYDECDKYIGDDICSVKRNNKWGIIDSVGVVVVPIIYEEKPFKASKDNIICLKKNGKYGYVDSKTFKPITEFIYERAGDFNHDVAQVMVNGKWEMLQNPKKIVLQQRSKPRGKKKAVSSFPAPNSEVDTNIPENKQKAEYTFAYIIANENYEIAKVPYALNDGWVFEKYCRQTLGIPDKNIHLYEDATAGNIIACIENLKETARAYEGDASIIFYYAGHAFPDEEEHSAYLLPIDGNSQNIATAYSLKKLYKEFNSVPVKQLICFIDACFSGTTRTDEMLIAGRGVAVKVKDDVPQGNAVVFTSATGAETAHSYEEKGHGMYTYYLLQKLQETQGDVTLGELTNYVRKMVRRKSVVVNEKMQTPCVIPSASLGTEWQSWKLK